MEDRIRSLFPHEQVALMDALRRDISSETEKAMMGGEWADYHQRNVKIVTRILRHLQEDGFVREAALMFPSTNQFG